ncbi:MAG: hypothetical protein L6V95_01540 [Candidatus Melainabacteria bacterium]|nr:MAG: hypothetical protein L6V95_01540 [Candidatus Melainabacteria bacterium]
MTLPELQLQNLAQECSQTHTKREKDPRGKTYYWMAGELIKYDGDDGTDINALKAKQNLNHSFNL